MISAFLVITFFLLTAAPSRPGRPQILNVHEHSAVMTWTPPANDGGAPVTQYVLERREIRGPRWLRVTTVAVPPPPPPHVVRGLADGAQYEFRVYAKNAVGVSEVSEMSRAVTCQEEGMV